VGFRGEVVNRRCCYPLPVLIAVVMLGGGCGTTKLPELVDLKGNKPWIFLAGAEVRQAKSLAMGAAVTKGWQLADAAGDKLLVSRPLSTTTAQAIAGEPVARAAIEVKTDFDQRRAGVDVIVAATMVADKLTKKGEKSAVKVDVTEHYRNELSLSLNALQRSWKQNRWRIAAAMRPTSTKGRVSKDEDRGDTFGTGADGKTDTPAPSPPETTATAPVAASSSEDRAVTAVASGTRRGPAPVEDQAPATPRPSTPSAPDRAMAAPYPGPPSALDRAMATIAPGARGEVAPVEDRALATPYPMAPSTTDGTMTPAAPIGVWGNNDRTMTTVPPVGVSSRAAPVEERALSRPRPITPSTIPGTVSAAGPTDIPALDRARRAGAWAYYAEQYARTHGCERADGRTTLEYRHPTFELHRIRCENGGSVFVQCSAEACVGLAEN